MTAWARRRALILGLVFIVFVGVIAYVAVNRQRGWSFATERGSYKLMIVGSDEARAKGLSGSERLNPGSAMLFVFDGQAERCIWMKDMNYSIDIVWVDSSFTVTGLESRISPETYPQTFCHDGQYVLELPAGDIQGSGLAVGSAARLKP